MNRAFSRPHLLPLAGGPFHIWSQGSLRGAGFSVAGLHALSCSEYAAVVDRVLDVEGAGLPDADRHALDAELVGVAAQAMDRQAEVLADIAGQERFQRAVIWQNHAVVRPMICGLAALPSDANRNQPYRKKQRVVAKYWTRYCSKNDTIGFFGPCSWFAIADGGPAVTMEPGPALMGWERTHFEVWPIDVLSGVLSRDPEIRPWVAPRVHPAMHHVPGILIQPEDLPAVLDAPTDALLWLCDGDRPARTVAAELVAAHPEAAVDQAAAFALLEGLVERGWVYWDMEPPLGEDPDLVLRGSVERTGEPAVRDRALKVLDTLVAARDKVAVAETPEALLTTMSELDATFVELTGENPSQRAGVTYGGRQLVYQDGGRDLALEIGPEVIESFAEPLSQMLVGARWLTHRLATHYEQVFATAFDQMAAQYGGDSVNFMVLASACGNELFVPGERGADRIMAEFVELWRDVLGMDTAASRVALTTAELAGRLGTVFDGSEPGWAYATHHGADIQIAAVDADALRAGEFEPVIGEIHVGWNCLQSTMFVNTRPHRDALLWLTNAGVEPRIMLTPVKTWPRITTRTTSHIDNGRDWWMSVTEFPGRMPGRQLALCELSVRRNGDRMEVVNGAGTAVFGVLDVIGVWMAEDIGEAFKGVAAGLAHSPRVTIDRLVAFRESWTFSHAGLPFLRAKGEHRLFVAVRRWLRAAGLPRFVFAKVSSEMKPFYVDFTSPVTVANLATTLRTALEADPDMSVTFSEMHPAPDNCWLVDADGRPYTGELRLQVVDCVTPI